MESYIQKLVKYIKKNLGKGYTIDSLKWALMSQGYSRTEVERAIRITNEELAKQAPIIKDKPIIKFKREPILEEISPYEPTFSDKFNSFWRNFKEFFRE